MRIVEFFRAIAPYAAVIAIIGASRSFVLPWIERFEREWYRGRG